MNRENFTLLALILVVCLLVGILMQIMELTALVGAGGIFR